MRFLDKIKITLITLLALSTVFFVVGCQKPTEPETIYNTPKVEIDNYDYNKNYNVYGEVVLDGKIDDDVWQNQSKLSKTVVIDKVEHKIEVSTYFADKGLVAYFKVMGAPAYFDQYLMPDNNTGLILNIADGKNTNLQQGTWEIAVDVGGVYRTKKYIKPASLYYGYHLYYAYMDRAVVVDGDINTKDSNGYVIEVMFPWSFITDDGSMPKSISMDASIIYRNSNTNSIKSTVSVSSKVLATYSSSNPKEWLRFSKDGYLGKDTPITYTVNDGNGVQNGQIIIDGSYGNGFLLTAKADDGYAFDSLTINGVNYQYPAVTFAPRKEFDLDVQVSFRPISGALRTISVTTGYAGCLHNDLPGGTVAILTDEDGNDYVGTSIDGKIDINLPNGGYKVSIDGYDQTTLAVNATDKNYSLQLDKNLFINKNSDIDYAETSSGYNFGFTNVSRTNTERIKSRLDVDLSNITVLDYVIRLEMGKNIFSSMQYHTASDKLINVYFNIGSWNKCDFLIKKDTTLVTSYNDTNALQTTVNGKTYVAVHLYQVIDGKTITLYNKTNDNLTLIGTLTLPETPKYLYVSFTDFKGELYYEDFKVLSSTEVLDKNKASVNVVDADSADVTIDKYFVGLGQSFTITATPTVNELDTSVITKITVNGVEIPISIDGNVTTATYTHVYGKVDKLDVKVYTQVVKYKDVTLNLVGKGLNGQDIDLVGKTGKVSGKVDKAVTVLDNGSLVVGLIDGDYVLSIQGFLPTAFSVSNDTTQVDLVIGQNIFVDDSTDFDLSYNEIDGFNFTSSVNKSKVYFDSEQVQIKDGIKISFTYTGYVDTGVKHWIEFIFKSSEGKTIQAQILTWGDQFILKNSNNSDEQVTIGTFHQEISFDLYFIVKWGKVSLYNSLNQHLGTLVQSSQTNSPLKDLVEFSVYYGYESANSYKPWSITNFNIEQI